MRVLSKGGSLKRKEMNRGKDRRGSGEEEETKG